MSRFTLGLTGLLAFACTTLPTELQPFDGTFEYAAFDQAGAQLLEGHLVIDVRSNGTITGTWTIDWVEGANRQLQVGPQIGRGSLIGNVVDGELVLNLNPQHADNDVGLRGTIDGLKIVGEWEYVTFAGPLGRGGFSADRL